MINHYQCTKSCKETWKLRARETFLKISMDVFINALCFQDNDECTWYGSFFVADMLLSWQIPPNISRRFLELWYGQKYTCYIIAILVSRNKVDFSVMDYHKLFKVWWLETMYPILDQKFFVLLLKLSCFFLNHLSFQ